MATPPMTFAVTEDCVKLGLRAGVIVFRGVNVGPRPPGLHAAIAEEVRLIRERFADPRAVRSLREVSAFHDILRQVAVNPRREQPSVERLLTFVLKRGDLPAINSLVDAYNLVSVRSLCSLGAHDLDRFTPPATLRLLTGGETFTPLGDAEPVAVTPGEYGYVDAVCRVLCRLDILQADFSKVTEQTRNALLIVEGTAAHAPEVLREACAVVTELVTGHCGGTAEVVARPE